MTKLIINENKIPVPVIPVHGGQLRANNKGELILVVEVSKWDNEFHRIVLRDDYIKQFDTLDHTPVSADYVISNHPHTIDNAVITVDINKEEE